MKTIEEQIEIMQHFANGGEIEYIHKTLKDDIYELCSKGNWNFDWQKYDYRIKEQKKTVTIEKWLVKDREGFYYVDEINDIDKYLNGLSSTKVKMLSSYEVEI